MLACKSSGKCAVHGDGVPVERRRGSVDGRWGKTCWLAGRVAGRSVCCAWRRMCQSRVCGVAWMVAGGTRWLAGRVWVVSALRMAMEAARTQRRCVMITTSGDARASCEIRVDHSVTVAGPRRSFSQHPCCESGVASRFEGRRRGHERANGTGRGPQVARAGCEIRVDHSSASSGCRVGGLRADLRG
jgi:hypothetical protein